MPTERQKTKPSFRSLFGDAIVYSVGDVLAKAIAVITMPIYTRIFSPEDYGAWSYVVTYSSLSITIISLGAETSYARHYFEAKTAEERQIVTSTWLAFLLVWSLSIVAMGVPFMFPLSGWVFDTQAYAPLFLLAWLSIPITLLNNMGGQALRNQLKPKLFTVLNLASLLLNVGFGLIGVLVLNWGLAGIFAGTLAAAVVMLPIRIWTLRDLLRPAFSFPILKRLLLFGIPLVPASLAYWALSLADRFILKELSTLNQLGLYAVANNVMQMLVLANAAFGRAWAPTVMQLYEDDRETASVFSGRAMTYILIGMGTLGVGITVFAPEMLIILTSPEFYPAASVVGLLAIGFMALGSTQVTALGISLTKKTYFIAILTWGAAILNVILNILLIPQWGMLAAGFATAVSYGLLSAAYLFVSQRLWPIRYEIWRSTMASVLSVGFILGASILPDRGLLVNLVVKSGYCLVFVLALIFCRVLDNREWLAIKRFIRTLPIVAKALLDADFKDDISNPTLMF